MNLWKHWLIGLIIQNYLRGTSMDNKERLLNLRKESIKKALEEYAKDIHRGGYEILRAARDGLLEVK